MTALCERLSRALVRNGLIKDEDQPIYSYGIEAAALKLLHTVTMLVIGGVSGLLLQTVVFIACYYILRAYAGGYHASTRSACYIITWVEILLVLAALGVCPASLQTPGALVISVLSLAALLPLVPVGNDNKELDESERRRYGFIARCTAAVQFLLAVILSAIGLSQMALVIALCLAASALSVLAGFLSNRRKAARRRA